MQRIFATMKQALGNSFLILGILSLSIVSSLFIFFASPSLAAPISAEGQKLMQQEKLDKDSQEATADRSYSYEEQVKAAEDPDKVYEKNAKAYKESHPGENLVEEAAEGAQKLIKNATK
ncbi:MAG: hypothetical protein JO235_14435 [Chroococcidiopsidaceae cyanobacterium CP_BM_RX_35]|nr:hypothetical protein [Chroococcidiopsidaceae cyanobacterium CP_BM_RX_35]